MGYVIGIPALLRLLPIGWWRGPARSADGRPVLYLTFDDGPTPGITERVLQLLAEYDARATFFVLGRQAKEHPKLLKQIAAAGHTIGSHGMQHRDSWRTKPATAFQDVEAAQRILRFHLGQVPRLYRPPYGRIHWRMWPQLRKQHQIVLWDVMPGDFDPAVSAQQCCVRILAHARPGSIIVLHDNAATAAKLPVILPVILGHFQELGYTFRGLPES
jgi:peptidoglycan/xylan/chitin deacetylase (PgdA/CDA1 family)